MTDIGGRTCYSPASPQLDPWCSGPTCQPVTLEIAGSNPVGSAKPTPFPTPRPPARTGRSSCPDGPWAPRTSPSGHLWQTAPSETPPRPDGHRPRRARDRRARLRAGRRPRRHASPSTGDRRAAGDGTARPAPASTGERRGELVRCRRPRAIVERGDPTPRRRPSPMRDVPIVPVTQFRSTATSATPDIVRQVLAGTEHPLRRPRARRLRDGRDPRRPRGGPPGRRGPAARGRRRRDPDDRPGRTSQAARIPPRRRRHAGGPRPGLGQDGALRDRADQDPRRLAAQCPAPWRAGRPGVRPGPDLDAVRGRRHPARPRRRPDGQDQGQGRRLPVRRRHGRHHRPLQGLLPDGLGPAVHEADGQRRGDASSSSMARTSPSRTSRTRHRTSSATTRRGRSSRPIRSSSRVWRTRASTGSASPTTTSATPGGPGILQTIKNLDKDGIASSGAGKDLKAARKPAILDANGTKVALPRLRHHRAGLHRERRSSRERAPDGQGGQGRRRGRAQGRRRPRHRLPALGQRVRPDARSAASARWPRPPSTPAPTWSSATTPTGRARCRSTRASRSGTRWATSSSTRPGRSRRWRASPSS